MYVSHLKNIRFVQCAFALITTSIIGNVMIDTRLSKEVIYVQGVPKKDWL